MKKSLASPRRFFLFSLFCLPHPSPSRTPLRRFGPFRSLVCTAPRHVLVCGDRTRVLSLMLPSLSLWLSLLRDTAATTKHRHHLHQFQHQQKNTYGVENTAVESHSRTHISLKNLTQKQGWVVGAYRGGCRRGGWCASRRMHPVGVRPCAAFRSRLSGGALVDADLWRGDTWYGDSPRWLLTGAICCRRKPRGRRATRWRRSRATWQLS